MIYVCCICHKCRKLKFHGQCKPLKRLVSTLLRKAAYGGRDIFPAAYRNFICLRRANWSDLAKANAFVYRGQGGLSPLQGVGQRPTIVKRS
mgnify:CR=1 FL=1